MNCQGHPGCPKKAVASFRVRYEGEILYRQEVCPYHEKLYEATKHAERIDK